MFCKNCGTEIPNNVAFCTRCGAPVQNQAQPQPQQPPQGGYYQPPQQQYYQPPVQQGNGKTPIISLVLGIVGIVFSLLIPIIGLIASVIGIVFGVKERKTTGKASGLTCSIIGASLAVVSWIISFLILSSLNNLVGMFL